MNLTFTTIELPQGITLEMVTIPGGTFLMGSPVDALRRSADEVPRHKVTVAPFFMGRYQITQAQWRAVASLPPVQRELKPDPSYFKGDNLPVEQVNWYEAAEFCARLSRYSHRFYRLPSEAEWEYACRSGTTTPFHFGETITTDLANYDGRYTFTFGPKGVFRQGTTDVGSFPPNGFGLYDLHGNVWEWCLDHYHDNYNGAPADGSAWVDAEAEENKPRILRGGSWGYDPRLCRCAFRDLGNPDDRDNADVGLRVVSVPPI